MSKEFKIPPQYQQKYSQRFSEECDKITISWSNDLKQWHAHAITALDFASIAELNIPSAKYAEMFKTEKQGINANIVAALANNLELRKPVEMGMDASEWVDVIRLNDRIGKSWNEITAPVHKRLQKEFEIMAAKPKIVTMAQA
jgi:hypothetical protein